MKQSGFFQKLFELLGLKRKKKPDEHSPLERILRKALDQSMLYLTGREPCIDVREVSFERFEKDIFRQESLRAIHINITEDVYPTCLVISGKNFLSLKRDFESSHREQYQNEGHEINHLAEHLLGNLHRLFTLDKADGSELTALRLLKTYGSEDAVRSLWWRLSGYRSYRIQGKGLQAFFLVENDHLRQLERELKEPESFELYETRACGKYDPEYESDLSRSGIDISIQNREEFVLASFFMPRTMRIKSTELRSLVTGLSIPQDIDVCVPEESYSIGVKIRIAEEDYVLFYMWDGESLIELTEKLGEELTTIYLNMINLPLKQLEKISGKTCRIARVLPGQRASFKEGIFPLILRYKCRIGVHELKVSVAIPHLYINLLAELYLEPWEIEYYGISPRHLLTSILSLNNTLFARHFPAFIKKLKSPGAVPLELRKDGESACLLFYTFLNQLRRTDLQKVIQSYISLGNSIGEIKKYYYVTTILDGQAALMRVYDFDEERMVSLLPEKWRSNYLEKDPGQVASLDRDNFIEENLRIMQKIYGEYIDDRLKLSPQAAMLLENEFGKVLAAEAAEELESMMKENLALNLYKDLDPLQKKKLIPHSTTRWFVLALIGSEAILHDLSSSLTKKNNRVLNENFSVLKDRFSSGLINTDELIKAKKQLNEVITTISQSDTDIE